MGCENTVLTVYVDGVPLNRPRKDYGCSGEVHRFTASIDIPGPYSYLWWIDNKLVGTGPYLDYNFDSSQHQIGVQVNGESCGAGATVTVKGKTCKVCPVVCRSQTAKIPAGEIVNLIDANGKIYTVGTTTVCKKASNLVSANAVKKAIRAGNNCIEGPLKVDIYYNQSFRNCLDLTITNSPVVFRSVKVGEETLLFDLTHCQ